MYGQEVTISIYRNTPSTKTLLSDSVIVIIKQKSFRYMSIAFISFRIGIVQNGSKKHGMTRVTITIVHISNNCATREYLLWPPSSSMAIAIFSGRLCGAWYVLLAVVILEHENMPSGKSKKAKKRRAPIIWSGKAWKRARSVTRLSTFHLLCDISMICVIYAW